MNECCEYQENERLRVEGSTQLHMRVISESQVWCLLVGSFSEPGANWDMSELRSKFYTR